ncbi:MAG: hypothetical protein ACOC0P_03990, partial [Planctomycetota bacterium]
ESAEHIHGFGTSSVGRSVSPFVGPAGIPAAAVVVVVAVAVADREQTRAGGVWGEHSRGRQMACVSQA